MVRYYHWIVEDRYTGKRFEIVKRGQLKDSDKYKVIGCCGFHEKKKEVKNNEK